jgi:hypothetical protein
MLSEWDNAFTIRVTDLTEPGTAVNTRNLDVLMTPLKEAIDHLATAGAQGLITHIGGGDRIVHARLLFMNPDTIIRANGQVRNLSEKLFSFQSC